MKKKDKLRLFGLIWTGLWSIYWLIRGLSEIYILEDTSLSLSNYSMTALSYLLFATFQMFFFLAFWERWFERN